MVLFGSVKRWLIVVNRDIPAARHRRGIQAAVPLHPPALPNLTQFRPWRSGSGNQPEPPKGRSASLVLSFFFSWSMS
jgi:hypothetical protein